MEYESEIYENLSFAYPPDWHVMEDTRLGILVSDTAFPDPLPPDVYAPVVIDERTQDMSEALETLREIDSEGRSENIEVNGHIGVKYTYETLSGPRVVYLLERSSDRLIGYGIDRTSDIGDAESILNTLVF
ncbi:MAG: hypothetical protein A3C90_01945 [Candidatus Magasanikbacteria bacterium RIFCSPHIGHO2_02_FULL_51_14]|uniref:Uncharacterized protein n=1 Tax=Candidatus Magasanikbacteria bacterium RIFCSPHIGHO2_02_FULL_51_14 TaxID=1798683 RepID=A0A1F6MDG9_9BACT|nr:MAG: hypothetical protein A3C90_01945 [Candidatus Magasanikbacteria bacterium RIFCSPHIGHO2_02_FULL_51_14]